MSASNKLVFSLGNIFQLVHCLLIFLLFQLHTFNEINQQKLIYLMLKKWKWTFLDFSTKGTRWGARLVKV
jgi:hypothetical protein